MILIRRAQLLYEDKPLGTFVLANFLEIYFKAKSSNWNQNLF